MVGQTISHYRILEKLGEGGMGAVYKAEDTRLERIVALKFLSQGFAKEEEKVRFLREAQAAAGLLHPNICPIYEIDEAEGRVFFAMAYLEGDTVSQLAEAEPLTFDDAASLARQVAAGLEEAHEHGVIHRDIKGQNIIVNAKGRAVILDFGLARTQGKTALTEPGVAMGTAPYMSPEQARGEIVDARTDLWALGVVLYEALTGRLPFNSGHHLATLYSIINEEPMPVSDLRPDVPPALERIVDKALAKDREQRWQTATEILAELGPPTSAFDSGETVASAPPALDAEPSRAVRRPWTLWAISAAAMFALAYAGWTQLPRNAVPAPPPVLAPNARALYDQGRYYLQRYEQSSNLDQAIALFEDAKNEDPDSALIEAGLAEAYYRKFKITDDRKWLDGALNTADHAAELDPDIAAPYAIRGLIRNDHGQHSQAIADFETALGLDPNHVDATRGLAEACVAQGRTAEAEELYKKAIQLAPGDWTGYKSLGIFYGSAKRYAEAEEQFRTVVRLTPDNALGYGNLGVIQMMLGKLEEAAETFRRAIEISPRAATYSNLGTLRFFQTRYSDAIGLYKQANGLNPNDEKYWGNLADAYRARGGAGDVAQAADAYQRAVELVGRRLGVNPTDAYRRSLLAYWLACLGRPRDAQAEIQQALTLAPRNSDVLFQAALVHQHTGNTAAALESYGAALSEGYNRTIAELHPDLRGLHEGMSP